MNPEKSDRPTPSTNNQQPSVDNKINLLLQAAADCASALLSDDDFERGVNRALEILGTSAGADRLGIDEHIEDATGETIGHLLVHPYEWLSSYAASQFAHPEMKIIPYDGIEELYEQLKVGQHWGGSIENFPEPFRSNQQEKLGVKATYSIPITIDGEYWGLIGLDFCQTARELSDAEIAVLKTAAACIGGAIDRERTRRAKEEAERNILLEREKTAQERAIQLQEHNRVLEQRDRILAATAEASSVLLTGAEFDEAVNRALQIIGETIDTDRVDVIEIWQNSSPFRSKMIKAGIKVLHAVPIFIENKYWGLIGIDDCREETRRSEAELSILKTAAACIGGAIERERTRRAKEEAERNILLERERAAQKRAIELAEHNRVLEQRDRILAATAEASSVLLAEDDFDEAINKALQIIGESIDTDRIVIVEIFENPSDPSYLYWKITYEWDSACAVSQISHPEVFQGSWEGIEEWYELFNKGQTISCQLEEISEPFRSLQAKLGVKTFNSVPIFIEGKYWGNVSVDDCWEETHRSEAELSILKTAAASIGGAIERERTRRAKEEADRQILLEREQAAQEKANQLEEHNRVLEQRDRILAATAEASNVLLTGEDFDEAVNRALQIIGEALDTDRVDVIEIWHNPSQPSIIPHWRMLYEWNSPGTISQISDPELSQGSHEGIEEWYDLLSKGQSIRLPLEEMSEPFRSGQAKIGVKVLYEVPIFIEGKFWGLIAFDDCREETNRSAAELSILKTAAACLGGAIERERSRRAKEEAERNILLERERSAQERAKLLQAVATVANSLLRSPDYHTALPEVLQILGEAVKSDRCSLVENVPDPITGKAAVKLHTEWCRKGITKSVESTPELETALLWEYFPQFQEKLTQGEISSFLIDELSEPARNILQAQRNVSMTLVPIMVQGEFWGVFGFDYCQEARIFEEENTAVFAIAVDSIAAAIAREQQNEALKASEKRFRELFEASNDAINFVEFDPPVPINLPIEEQIERIYSSYRFTDINPAGEIHCGLSRSEIVGKPLTVIHSPESAGHRSLMRRMIENGWQITNAESEDIDANGKKRYWLSHLFTTIENGYALRGWGVVNNITPLKEAQQALLEAEQARSRELEAINAKLQQALKELAESEKRYRTLFELSNEGIYRFEMEQPFSIKLPIERQLELLYRHCYIAEANNTFADHYKLSSPEEIIGTKLVSFYAQDSETNLENNRTIFENGYQLRNGETEETDANGQPRYFLWNVVCDIRDGYFWGGWGMQTDITELKQAQQALLEAERQRVAQLEQSNQVLSLRDRWLEATANAANQLLATPDLDAGINAALKMLGESLDCDRVCVLQHSDDPTGKTLGFWCQLYEWDSLNTISQLHHPQLNKISIDSVEDHFAQLLAGQWWGGLIDEFPEPFRSGQIELGVKSTYAVPIFVDGNYWGIIGVDYCREPKRLTEVEIAVFKTAASCVGSAIYRQQIQQEREEAERQRLVQLEASNQVLSLRDRWLEATANAANRLLATPDLDTGINAALKMLGESLDCDRVDVMQHFEDDTGEYPAFVRLLYEWNSTYTTPQILYPHFYQATWHEEWLISAKAGEFTGGTIDELDEPCRSEQLEVGVKSLYNAPIFVNEKFWGILGIDFCREARQLTLPEIAVFKTAASCVGSAIYRQQIQQEREEAERQRVAQLEESNQILSLRDRWLEATANAANRLLATPDLDAGINAALKMLGESLDCDRIDVMQHFEDDTKVTLGYMQMLHEWDSTDTNPQILHPELNRIIWHEEFREWAIALKAGEFAGGIVEEFTEPFRSEQLELGCQSTYAAPIFVGEQFWGILGINFCREARRLTLPEIAVFKTAASCVGSAIYRQQTIAEQKEAERAVLEERNHLAREIHDTIGQSFTAIVMQLEAGKRLLSVNPDRVSSCLNLAQNLAHQGITQVQQSLWTLRENADEYNDLVAAFQRLVATLNTNVPVRIKFSSSGTQPPLSPDVSLNLLRIGQEAVTNALKHAEARQIDLNLIFNSDRLQLEIKDDGRGFAPELLGVNSGFGIRSIEQRAEQINAVVNIITNPGNGTAITVTVPLTII